MSELIIKTYLVLKELYLLILGITAAYKLREMSVVCTVF
jgi:hypothetical protein